MDANEIDVEDLGLDDGSVDDQNTTVQYEQASSASAKHSSEGALTRPRSTQHQCLTGGTRLEGPTRYRQSVCLSFMMRVGLSSMSHPRPRYLLSQLKTATRYWYVSDA